MIPPPATKSKAGWGVALFERGPPPTEPWQADVVKGRLLMGKKDSTTENFEGTLNGMGDHHGGMAAGRYGTRGCQGKKR